MNWHPFILVHVLQSGDECLGQWVAFCSPRDFHTDAERAWSPSAFQVPLTLEWMPCPLTVVPISSPSSSVPSKLKVKVFWFIACPAFLHPFLIVVPKPDRTVIAALLVSRLSFHVFPVNIPITSSRCRNRLAGEKRKHEQHAKMFLISLFHFLFHFWLIMRRL